MPATVWSVLMLIDGAIYNLICYVYEIFYYLATLNIFTEEHYQGIVNRIYVVLGLFMLFVLAYSLLRAIIDPDNFAKKENSFPNLIKNVIISLIIIVLLPTVFSVAFNIQNAVLNNDTIPKLILGLDGATEDTSGGGRTIAYYLYKAFLYPNSDYCTSEGYTDIEECRDSIRGNGWLFVTNGDQLTVMDQAVLNGSSFTNYNDYSESVRDGKLSYLFPISTVAGIFTLYVLLNFCFDMAIRVVKLAFYQIIAPIPVICRVMPGGSMKDVFNKWIKQIISIFLEVFIRIAVLAIGIYLINIVVETYNNGLPNIDSLGLTQRPIVLALIIMGIVIFMRQAPQILGDLLGLKTDGMKLGLMDKLAMGGGLFAGAVAGGGLTSAVRNWNATRREGGGGVAAFRSAIGGFGSGAARGAFGARGAKNFKDMRGAAHGAVEQTTAARLARLDRKRDRADLVSQYESDHNRHVPKYLAGAAGLGLAGVAGVRTWATGGVSQYEEQAKLAKEFKSSSDAIFDEAGNILGKNSNNPAVVAQMDKFKGDNDGELKRLYDGYSGFSLDMIKEDINTQSRMTDFSGLVDRDSFYRDQVDEATGETKRVFDAAGYQAAIERETRKHAVKIANLRNMYNQLEKESKMHIVNAALNGDINIEGIDDSKLQGIRDKVETFRQEYSRFGNSVDDPVPDADGNIKSYGSISQSGDIAHQIDDIATAFDHIGSQASVKANRYKSRTSHGGKN